MKNWLTWICVLGQFAAFSAFAAAVPGASTSARTPEFQLLEQSAALSGQKLSPEQMKSAMTQLVTQYTLTAPREGSEQRMAQAMVDLGLSTPAQAQKTADGFQASAARLAISGNDKAADLSTTAATELNGILVNAADGAQFSATDADCTAALAITAGGTAFLTWAAYDWSKTSSGGGIIGAILAGAFAGYGIDGIVQMCFDNSA